jgi:hypothetical protein
MRVLVTLSPEKINKSFAFNPSQDFYMVEMEQRTLDSQCFSINSAKLLTNVPGRWTDWFSGAGTAYDTRQHVLLGKYCSVKDEWARGLKAAIQDVFQHRHRDIFWVCYLWSKVLTDLILIIPNHFVAICETRRYFLPRQKPLLSRISPEHNQWLDSYVKLYDWIWLCCDIYLSTRSGRYV